MCVCVCVCVRVCVRAHVRVCERGEGDAQRGWDMLNMKVTLITSHHVIIIKTRTNYDTESTKQN